MFPESSDSESVQFNILLEAAQALKELEYLRTDATTLQEVFDKVQQKVSATATSMGVQFMTMEKQFKDVIVMAEQLRTVLATMPEDMQNKMRQNPVIAKISGVESPFSQVSQAAGWTEVNAIQKQILSGQIQGMKLADQTAKEINKQTDAEMRLIAERRVALNLAQQELIAVEKAGAATTNQIKNFGQVSRTASETMNLLRSFSGTEQGQGILTKFLGDYNASKGVVQQIDSIKTAVTGLSKSTGASFSQAGTIIKEQFGQVPGITNQVGQAVQQLGNKFEDTSKKSNGLVGGINVMRIALGALVSMILFSVVQAFGTMVREALKGVREMELAILNLINTERRMSEMGIDINPQQLNETIKKLKELDPLLSNMDASELVSSIATKLGPTLKFGAKEIDSISQSIAILAIRNRALGKTFEEVKTEVVNAFLSGRVSAGINDLGIKINDQIVREEAVRLGLVKTAEAFDLLTGKQEQYVKGMAIVSLLEQNTADERSHLPEFFKTADAAFGVFQANLSDVLTELGSQLGPLLIRLFTAAGDALENLYNWMVDNKDVLSIYVKAGTELVFVLGNLVGFAIKFGTAIGWGLGIAIKNVQKLQEAISKIPFLGKLVEGFQSSRLDLASAPDTPTGSGEGESQFPNAQKFEEKYAEAVTKAEDEITDLMKEARDKRLDIERDYQRKLEDIARNHSQKLQDIARNTTQKTEDANRNYGQKIEDINRDANQKIAEAQEDSHKKELDAEAEFQRKLAELRQSFLFDLEDALHERDARQVLRLIRQYNFDKKNLEDKRKQEQEESKLSLQNKLADIEIERQQKLEAAKREQEEKLAEIALYAQRERADAAIANRRALADARLDHQRKLQENREYLKRKLQDIADAITKEFQLTAAGAQAISSLLGSYFGAGGAVANIFGGLQSQLGGMTQVGGSGAVSGNGSFQDFGSTFNTLTGGKGYGFAEGGTLIATRPTKAIFGEKGPEQVSFAPLGRVGRNVNQAFGGSGAGANGGSITLEVALSPDLEARIIDSSLENVALTLEKISRSK